MKTKDIVTVLVAIVLIGGSVFAMYKMLAPTKKTTTTTTTTHQTETKITGKIDEETLKLISEKKDYGEAALDNIGRTNPFGPIN